MNAIVETMNVFKNTANLIVKMMNAINCKDDE